MMIYIFILFIILFLFLTMKFELKAWHFFLMQFIIIIPLIGIGVIWNPYNIKNGINEVVQDQLYQNDKLEEVLDYIKNRKNDYYLGYHSRESSAIAQISLNHNNRNSKDIVGMPFNNELYFISNVNEAESTIYDKNDMFFITIQFSASFIIIVFLASVAFNKKNKIIKKILLMFIIIFTLLLLIPTIQFRLFGINKLKNMNELKFELAKFYNKFKAEDEMISSNGNHNKTLFYSNYNGKKYARLKLGIFEYLFYSEKKIDVKGLNPLMTFDTLSNNFYYGYYSTYISLQQKRNKYIYSLIIMLLLGSTLAFSLEYKDNFKFRYRKKEKSW